MAQLHWLPVQFRIKFKLCLLMHQIHVGRCPAYLAELVSSSAENRRRSGLRSTSTSRIRIMNKKPRLRTKFAERAFSLGLPTLDLGIPGRPPPFPSLPSIPSPPSFPFPVGPTPKPAMGSRERCRLPSGVWGKAPADKRFGALYLLPKGAALVATVFVHFHNNKFKFLYKHKTV